MRHDRVGVMIARGDLAVECGYERLAYEAFGSEGNASRIMPLSLDAMTARYEKGQLSPRIQ
jgi:hypothetical protein